MVHETLVTSATGGQKGRKMRRIDLIPAEPLGQVGDAYGYGAEKYAERNWERGYDWSLALAALYRHLNEWQQGETHDEETSIHHLASVIFHALSLLEFERTHPEMDDIHQDAETDAQDDIISPAELQKIIDDAQRYVAPYTPPPGIYPTIPYNPYPGYPQPYIGDPIPYPGGTSPNWKFYSSIVECSVD